ncbi:DNA-binding transcriptional regulator, Lrp family [Nocardioides terrae]|uniref:DNA-binding transcriptional regulator, Lrp family n=1 Tax=Nocardioides terrae TaxID=574651 RepID=A0A1I1NKW2_9ACTN|nr:Lrp/AsnC ligand binding domain-containing protein [Nocardioides terrae]SFC98105.1 DNA-binding transcriptional regulator, Lrp family [Nocardioides terrae]
MVDETITDALDVALLRALHEHPRAGDLELSRTVKVARATVQSRLRRLDEAGVVRDWAPTLDVSAAGFAVHAFVTLEIAQGALDEVTADLAAIPEVLEAHVTTGAYDVVCRVATASHAQLQDVLVRIDQSPSVRRSVSVVILSELIPPRALPLLESRAAPVSRAPAYRSAGS